MKSIIWWTRLTWRRLATRYVKVGVLDRPSWGTSTPISHLRISSKIWRSSIILSVANLCQRCIHQRWPRKRWCSYMGFKRTSKLMLVNGLIATSAILFDKAQEVSPIPPCWQSWSLIMRLTPRAKKCFNKKARLTRKRVSSLSHWRWDRRPPGPVLLVHGPLSQLAPLKLAPPSPTWPLLLSAKRPNSMAWGIGWQPRLPTTATWERRCVPIWKLLACKLVWIP